MFQQKHSTWVCKYACTHSKYASCYVLSYVLPVSCGQSTVHHCHYVGKTGAMTRLCGHPTCVLSTWIPTTVSRVAHLAASCNYQHQQPDLQTRIMQPAFQLSFPVFCLGSPLFSCGWPHFRHSSSLGHPVSSPFTADCSSLLLSPSRGHPVSSPLTADCSSLLLSPSRGPPSCSPSPPTALLSCSRPPSALLSPPSSAPTALRSCSRPPSALLSSLLCTDCSSLLLSPSLRPPIFPPLRRLLALLLSPSLGPPVSSTLAADCSSLLLSPSSALLSLPFSAPTALLSCSCTLVAATSMLTGLEKRSNNYAFSSLHNTPCDNLVSMSMISVTVTPVGLQRLQSVVRVQIHKTHGDTGVFRGGHSSLSSAVALLLLYLQLRRMLTAQMAA